MKEEKEDKGFVSFLQRIEELKRMVFSKGDITYNTGVNDVKKVFLLCLKEFEKSYIKYLKETTTGEWTTQSEQVFENLVKRFLGDKK